MTAKQVYVIKLGETFPDAAAELGDFEHWIAEGLETPVEVVDPRAGDPLPAPGEIAGAVVTGSHSMVTERLPWSERTAQWLVELTEQQVPVLGICYGHQLLAQAHGGEVDYRTGGMEIGTVQIQLTPEAARDRLFSGLPPVLPAQAVHSQSVRRLPAGAIALAGNEGEPYQAFRLGASAWGVQFHPEFDEEISRTYVRRLAPKLQDQQRDAGSLETRVKPTPAAASILVRFARLAAEAASNAGDG